METVENQDAPPLLDAGLAPTLLFDYGDGAGAAGEPTDDARFLYSIPKRRLQLAKGFDHLVDDVNWITPQGWVLTLDPDTRDASLRDPFTSRRVPLPPDRENLLSSSEDTKCVLSTHRPADPGCVVLVVHLTDPVLCYCRPGDRRWLRHEYRPELLIFQARGDIIKSMASLTAAGGRFYTDMFGDGKLVTLAFSPGPELSISDLALWPFPAGCCFAQSCVVESCGDLFWVQFCYTGLSDRRVLCVEVHKLDWSKSALVKVAEIGDNRVFFARRGQFGASMAADELGLKPNCIYYSDSDDKGLYIYDMEQGTTKLCNPGPDVEDSIQPILLMVAT
ncbi:hypothetical protein ACP70R_006769 [Stipagrostis hirtigluma subsp. patula]